MSGRLDPIPEGYGTVTPWISTKDTARVIEFLKAAFDAEELGRVEGPVPGRIGHAEVRIGTSIVMLFDTPFKVDTPALLRLYVEDAEAVLQKAVDAGAVVVTPLTDVQAWGDRIARLRDRSATSGGSRSASRPRVPRTSCAAWANPNSSRPWSRPRSWTLPA